jgi:hypothetical protein
MPPVQELRPGLWHWQAPHPEWTESEPWDKNVSSYAADDGDALLLFDPIDPPSEIEELDPERDTSVVLTAPWDERDVLAAHDGPFDRAASSALERHREVRPARFERATSASAGQRSIP